MLIDLRASWLLSWASISFILVNVRPVISIVGVVDEIEGSYFKIAENVLLG